MSTMMLVNPDRGWPFDVVEPGSWLHVGGKPLEVVAIHDGMIATSDGRGYAWEAVGLVEMSEEDLCATNLGFPASTRECFLSVYEVTRHYGGPEEGGWWYDRRAYTGQCRKVSCMEAREAREEWQVELEPDQPEYDRFSVLGWEGDLVVYIEGAEGENDTSRQPRPHYE